MGALAKLLQEQQPEQKKSAFAEALQQVQPAAPVIQQKVQAGQTLSRSDLYNLGVDERTNAQQRKVITDTLRRQSPFVAAGMGGYSPRITKQDVATLDRSERAAKATARGVANVGSAFQQMRAGLLEPPTTTKPGPPPSRFGVPITPERAKETSVEAKRLRESATLLWKVSKDPEIAAGKGDVLDKVIDLTFEAVPYITATTGAYLATGPLGGFAVGSMVEGNTAYRTALDTFTEANKGKPPTPEQQKRAKRVGFGVGLAAGAIEAFGGKAAEEILVRAAAKIKTKALKAGTILTTGTVIEALEEGGQEVAHITGEETYRDVDWKERVNRVLGSMAGGALLGGIMKGGSTAMRTGISLAEGQPVSAEKPPQVTPEAPVTTEIKEPSIAQEPRTTPPEVVAVEKPPVLPIPPEQQAGQTIPADLTARAKTLGIPTKGLTPAAVQNRVTEAEAEIEETPEEAQAAEARLAGEAAEEIEPNLYIGNVTAGMKKRMSETGEFKAEDVKGFTEQGFPTKRTKIKMSRGEAEMYLDWLEKDLQDRVDNNKIETGNQMAWAKADWGDVKNLRKSLGHEVGQQPFRVMYAQKEGIVSKQTGEIARAYNELRVLRKQFDKTKDTAEASELEDRIMAQEKVIDQMQRAAGKAVSIVRTTREAIRGAVEPSTLQESKMTVQEVLRATLKRSARYAKMAYAKGRTELRAAIRAKARAKARMKKAVKAIKRPVPRTVDVLYREAIEAIQATIDPALRSTKTLQKREALREYIERNPEKAKDIPTKLINALSKKPLNDYTIEELEEVAKSIETLKDLGGLRRRLEVSQYEKSKAKDLEAIKAGSVPINEREMLKPEKIGAALSFKSRAKNKLSKMLNIASQKHQSVVPMDVVFDMMDKRGAMKYQGPNHRIFKENLDNHHDDFLDSRDENIHLILKLRDELGLTEGNFERITTYGAVQQKNGRQKLLNTGYTEKQIDEVQLTPEEMQFYKALRKGYSELLPQIEQVMHDVFNEPIEIVKNYSPFLTDFESMSDYEIREMYGDKTIEFSSELRKNVEKGFAITRTGGKQKIKMNALEIYLQHMDNATWLIYMGPEIKRLSEIAATEEYGKAVGNVGQEEVRSWLDMMARKGRSQRNKTIPIMNVFRKHTGAAIIGAKLSSILVNATPLLDGAGMIGRYAFQGASDVATSRQWREFLLKMPEVRDRIGGDIEFLDFGRTTIEKVEKAGFWPLQQVDGLSAASVAAGAYQKYLDEHGLKMDFENPNREAQTYAQLIMRRSQSSGFFKDLPSAFTRGTFSGNTSVDRLIFQFQSFILNRWSLIEHDMIRAGIKTRDVPHAMNMFFWLAMAGFAEMGLRRLSKELIAFLTGDDLDDWSETFTKEVVINTIQNIPFVSQLVSFYNYGNMPIPTVSLIQDVGEKIVWLRRTKDPDKRKLKILELIVIGVGAATGMPGTMQISEIIRSYGKEEQPKRGTRAAREQRATRK